MAQSAEASMAAQLNGEVLTAFRQIPYALINAEVAGPTQDVLSELAQICKYYKTYRDGAAFTTEGTNGDYVPATLRYKMCAALVNKEARFLFAEPPTIQIEPLGNIDSIDDTTKGAVSAIDNLVRSILDANTIEDKLLKAAKDCFIGKRVAALVNFNERDGVTLSFLASTQFIYETQVGNPDVLTKFVCFDIVRDSMSSNAKRIFKKKYTVEDDIVYLEESMHDGSGRMLEEVTPKQPTLLERIPAVVFINDGLSGERNGVSEVEILIDYERWYSKLSNADIDAERKSMNPVRYTIDMEQNSTVELSSSAGSYWDLQSDQNLDKPAPSVGTLESSMAYSTSLDVSLNRIKGAGFEQVDVPNISLETMSGAITSGKALKAIYWPLIVRCKEKMKMWGPQLRTMVNIIIEGALVYPNCITKYTDTPITAVPYKVRIEQNTPLREDEAEEKNIDLAEVTSQTMSRKAYMKKWRGLTDAEVDDELAQIAYERQTISDVAMMPSTPFDDVLGDEGDSEQI